LVLLNLFNLTHEIHIHGTSPLCLLNQLPSNEQDWKKSNHEVTEHESGDIPFAGQEHSVSSDKGHNNATDEAIPRKVRLTPSLERKLVAIESLCVTGALPEDEGHTHNRVIDELRCSHQVDEPLEYGGGVCTDLQEGKKSNAQNDERAVDRYTSARGTCKYLGCFPLECETIEGARCAIDVTVTSRESTCKNHSVNNGRKYADAETVHGHDVGRCCCTREAISSGSNQFFVVVGNQNADTEGAEHEESGQTVEDSLECFRHDDTRVLGLTSCHADIVRSSDSERSLDETLEEAKEVAKIATIVERGKGARIVPVSEPKSVSKWVAAQHDDEGEDDKTNNQQHFTESCPELGLAIPLYGEDVNQGIEHDDNSNNAASWNNITPVVNDDVASSNLERDLDDISLVLNTKGTASYQNCFKDEEIPAGCETYGFVHVATGESDEGR